MCSVRIYSKSVTSDRRQDHPNPTISIALAFSYVLSADVADSLFTIHLEYDPPGDNSRNDHLLWIMTQWITKSCKVQHSLKFISRKSQPVDFPKDTVQLFLVAMHEERGTLIYFTLSILFFTCMFS